MSDDIVERLRRGEPCLEASGCNDCKVKDAASGCLCAIAADAFTALRAENERLRAALDTIANGQRDADLSYAELFAEVRIEARAALEKK